MPYVIGALSTLLLVVSTALFSSPVSGATQAPQSRVVITIKGMICASCGGEIEKTLNKMVGVVAVKVDLPTDRATVTYDQRKVTPPQLVEAIRKAGYEAFFLPVAR